MTVGNISTSFSAQNSLTALANTKQLLQKTEQALATGKSVSAPTDNAPAFYAAQAFIQQANNLAGLKDNLSTSLSTLNSTQDSITSATQVVQQLQGIVTQAGSTTDATARAALASQYNALLPQLDNIANDASFNGTNLLNGGSNPLIVATNTTNTANISISPVDATANGLGITGATNNFASASDLSAASAQLSSALSTLNTSAANFGGNSTLIQTNQDFTSNLISNLQSAADNLTSADLNQEGANLQALQAQNQLGIVSLSIAGQLEQAVLKLFG
jgi:flagellin-like hook-associated protein FlgL